MPSGGQLKKENFERFQAWVASKSDEDFREYVHRGQLSRTEIAKECEFGKSALTQNPDIRNALNALENRLRSIDILPALATDPEAPDKSQQGKTGADDRLKRLEGENAMLRVELDKYKRFTERYSMMEKFMSETMRMPR